MGKLISEAARKNGRTPIRLKFWRILAPFFTKTNEDCKRAWGWLVLMLALLVLESGVLVAFSYAQRDFSTAMSNKDQEGFYRGTRRYVTILLAAAPLFALSRFVQGKLGLDWRRWLTEHLCGLYFGNRAFYALKIGYLSPGKTTTTAAATMGEREESGEVAGPAGGEDAACEEEEEEEEQRGGITHALLLRRENEKKSSPSEARRNVFFWRRREVQPRPKFAGNSVTEPPATRVVNNPVSAIDNPDQRIGEDISTFTRNCIDVVVVFVGALLKVGSFVGVLLSISPRLTAFVVVYSALGTLSTTALFGARLKHLIFEGAKREANFRFGLVRVREHAEEIAFYRGEKGEKEGIKRLLEKVVSNIHLRLWCDAQLAVFSNSFMWLTAVLPYLVVAERYFAGEMEFGVISQTAMAFRVIQGALSVVVSQIRTLASLASEVDRLYFLQVCMEDIAERPPGGGGGGSAAGKGTASGGALSAVDSGAQPAPSSLNDGYVAVPLGSDGVVVKKDGGGSGGGGGGGEGESSGGGDENGGQEEEEEEGVLLSLDGAGGPGGPATTAAVDGGVVGGGGGDRDGGGRGRITTVVKERGFAAAGEKGEEDVLLKIEDMTLFTPDRRQTICRELSFRVTRGQSVLIFGPSGCGKSSLLRGVSGLWTAGEGRVSRHSDNEMMFIPQKPYLPLGSLRAQMLYPRSEDEGLSIPATLEGILEQVQLGYLCSRSGGLGANRDWQDELSLGEQQRLAFSRLLTNSPSMAFLDEATSALDEQNEARLYAWLQALDAYVSVGHRSSLFRYHTHVLRGQSDGQWFFHTMQDFLDNHYSPALLGE